MTQGKFAADLEISYVLCESVMPFLGNNYRNEIYKNFCFKASSISKAIKRVHEMIRNDPKKFFFGTLNAVTNCFLPVSPAYRVMKK